MISLLAQRKNGAHSIIKSRPRFSMYMLYGIVPTTTTSKTAIAGHYCIPLPHICVWHSAYYFEDGDSRSPLYTSLFHNGLNMICFMKVSYLLIIMTTFNLFLYPNTTHTCGVTTGMKRTTTETYTLAMY